MERIFSSILNRLEAGEAAVLCRVVSASGSAPRGPGARMAVFAGGRALGTVGGGAAELRTTVEALRSLRQGRRGFCVSYSLGGGEGEIGMICGGEMTVLLQLLGAADIPLLSAAASAEEGGEPAWLVTDFSGGGEWTMSLTREGPADLLGPRPVFRPGRPARYAEPVSRLGTVYLFGGGHVGQALAPLLAGTSFRTVVYDDRPEIARRELFPQAARVILGDYGAAAEQVRIRERDYVVVMTHGHQSDETVLTFALKTPAAYIGCIGSRRKTELLNRRLSAAGFRPADLRRIHAPIGLPIAAETPEEIAVSIAAELIACRAAQEGGRKAGEIPADGRKG